MDCEGIMSGVSADELNSLLFGSDTTLVNIKCFTGDGQFTETDLRREIASALQQRKSGTASISDSFNDDAQKIDIRAAVASLHI